MKFLLLLVVLSAAYAQEITKPRERTHIVVVDPKPTKFTEEDARQAKRSIYDGIGYGAAAPVALPEPGFGAAPIGVGFGAAPVGVGLASDIAPAPLYGGAIAADSVPLGSGYAPSYPSYPVGNPCLPPIPAPSCTPPPQIITQHVEVPKPVPVPVYKHVAVPVPQPVPYPVPQPVAVKVPHPVPVPVEVIKNVPVPVPVEKPIPIPYPVDRPFPVKVWKKVPVFVPKPYPVHIYKVKHIYHKSHHKGWDWD